MLIVVNGESRDLPDSASITELVSRLGLAEVRLAVEVNGEIAPRADWSTRALKPADQIEIVRAIGGG